MTDIDKTIEEAGAAVLPFNRGKLILPRSLKGFKKQGVMDMDCKYFDGCSAPLCPRDEGVADRTWFADEEICRLADVPEWVKRQRKVSRRAASDGYFTLAMLRHDCRIPKGIKGIDPNGTDAERAADEAAWFKVHPVITAELREKRRATGQKNKGFINGNGCKNDLLETGLDAVPGEKGSEIPPAGISNEK